MKTIILLLLFAGSVSAQDIYKMKSLGYAVRTVDNRGNWEDWPEWEEAEVMVTIRLNDTESAGNIKIFSSKYQEYDLIELLDDEGEKGGKTFQRYLAEDEDGIICHVRFIIGDTMQMYVMYSDWQWVYSLTER